MNAPILDPLGLEEPWCLLGRTNPSRAGAGKKKRPTNRPEKDKLALR